MILTDELKILDSKIKANQAQYYLSREAAKIFALSCKDLLSKYEYLTGKDLGHRSSALEKFKFQYSPLGKVFTKGLDKNDQKDGLLKRLKDIGDKNEKQLKVIRDQGEKQLDAIKNIDINSKPLKTINFLG